MKLAIPIALVCVATASAAEEKGPEQQIAETVQALPEALRDGATVIGYDAKGERSLLRSGTNDMICWADDPGLTNALGQFFVKCFPKSMEAYYNRELELSSTETQARLKMLDAEVKSGKLTLPAFGARYTLRGASAGGAMHLTTLQIPYATAETLEGISTEPNNSRPWLMWEGTVGAHIMLPGL
jgi:hypothetical protein